ncbi:unnamed protein product [Leptidea sinapis]|uniref:Non-canonical purine NTP phosphatase/PRRC1 domain-containing protein n=1 Tax=Leptidea sinapis TaxID=189913 RepID=A0A5E4QHN2_9NEOP|nr:unnamed protein product [Leptidea sinapis]
MNISERKKIPAAPTLAATGNLLSSVAPPSELPNFITSSIAPVAEHQTEPTEIAQNVSELTKSQDVTPIPMDVSPQTPDTFSPVIPLAKGQPTLSVRSPEESDTIQSPEPSHDYTPDVDRIGDIMPGSGLMTWVKGAVSGGGLLQKVAEKAKSSVDSMITTLDPQMKEYLRSGGDFHVVVASDKDIKVSPVREAFQTVFGKATVVGEAAHSDVTATQPVGYASAYAAAKQRIAHIRSSSASVNNNVPVVAIESFLHEAIADRWYEVSLIVLTQPSLDIELHVQSQGTPVPAAAALAARDSTPADYEHAQTGYSTTIGRIMADNLQVAHTEWQQASTGVSRREALLLAARSLAGSYRNILAISAAQP